MSDCIFCKIIQKEIPVDLVYEDDDVLAFKDIAPKAPVHILIIPKKHIPDLAHLQPEDAEIIGKIHLAAVKIAAAAGLAKAGYRLVNNCGRNAGQEVFHIHYHLLGGAPLGSFTAIDE